MGGTRQAGLACGRTGALCMPLLGPPKPWPPKPCDCIACCIDCIGCIPCIGGCIPCIDGCIGCIVGCIACCIVGCIACCIWPGTRGCVMGTRPPPMLNWLGCMPAFRPEFGVRRSAPSGSRGGASVELVPEAEAEQGHRVLLVRYSYSYRR